MRRCIFLLTVLTVININTYAQLYFTKNGNVNFFSKTILEDIKADNNQVLSVLNIQTGTLRFSLLNNAFHFAKAKMEDDFNENYMESNKYPKSTFNGAINDINNIDFNKDGTYKVNVTGDLMIHGVTKNITIPATISVKNGKISGSSVFNVAAKDYQIKIPTIVTNKIAENIKVTVLCDYEKK